MLLVQAGCGGEPGPGPTEPAHGWPSQPPTTTARPQPSETGKASYIADSLAGNATASGERYDPQAFTAAHRKLPFGTIVDVTTRDHSRRVRVRINDRGPFVAGRVIDLSRAAAEQLDMIHAGVVDVNIYLVAWPPPAPK
ncbi:MAG: septal ring lytic transglycosylase RlpA family protein [Deltaproteobacteria bacterium]|nr:septal ring lytic transglycosylase RlpA family protein [Deltaproteobacteria bacterium]